MGPALTRRGVLVGGSLVAGGACRADEASALADLEAAHAGRLGVTILDTRSGRRIDHRADERFALCSTFKVLASAAVLARVDRGEDRLESRVAFGSTDLVEYSPITGKRAGERDGMTLAELCEAAITLSDNTAANLILDRLGGPPALTAYLRSLGDAVTRLDRREPTLNEATPGDPRDTTTPSAMANTLRYLLLGDALSASAREQLAAWMVACRTGDQRLRAGLPAGWRVGDKTGTGSHNATNDVAVVWPPDRAPLVVAAYYVELSAAPEQRNAVLGGVGRLAASFAGTIR